MFQETFLVERFDYVSKQGKIAKFLWKNPSLE